MLTLQKFYKKSLHVKSLCSLFVANAASQSIHNVHTGGFLTHVYDLSTLLLVHM